MARVPFNKLNGKTLGAAIRESVREQRAEEEPRHEAMAANGHRMVYRVIGHERDGYPIVSQYDAEHSEDCPCMSGDSDKDPWSA